MSIALIRELWDYHHWANRRLFDIALGLGDAVTGRAVGAQFSVPTLRGMFVHVYVSDLWWLRQWRGGPKADVGPDEQLPLASLGELRPIWDELISDQRRFVTSLDEADLARVLEVKRSHDGQLYRRPLGTLLLHVPNHATHHRSEIATMLTMTSGAPPDTGINSYYAARGEQ